MDLLILFISVCHNKCFISLLEIIFLIPLPTVLSSPAENKSDKDQIGVQDFTKCLCKLCIFQCSYFQLSLLKQVLYCFPPHVSLSYFERSSFEAKIGNMLPL